MLIRFINALIMCLILFQVPVYSNAKDIEKKLKLKPGTFFIVDDFEDATMSRDPEWWGFGDMKVSYIYNSAYNLDYLGKVSVKFEGKSKNSYVGGAGVYTPVDGRLYNDVLLVVHGIGKYSGTLIIELYDDDNGNWQIEPHPHDRSMTMADDRFRYYLDVNWLGWKEIRVPIKHFTDANPGIGDDVWNPSQTKGSGGLLQIQLIALTAKKKGHVNFILDSVLLVK